MTCPLNIENVKLKRLVASTGFLLGIKDNPSIVKTTNRFRNPFDVSRRDLLDQIVRMRANYLQPSVANTKLIDDDARHSLPIGQMGNYQDYLKKMPVPLREIESTPVRQHMFGESHVNNDVITMSGLYYTIYNKLLARRD